MNTCEYSFSSEAFEPERLRYHNGPIFGLAQVMEVTLIDDESEIHRAMEEGTLPFLTIGERPIFHEDDVRDFIYHRWQDARTRARQARMARRVQERYRTWQAAGAVGTLELRTCPECGTVMIVRGPTRDDVDGLEFWRGDRYGECDFCGYADYFAATEPSVSDQRF